MTELMTEAGTEAVAVVTPTVFGTFRMPRVNLLPPEIEQARQLRRTQRALAGGLLGVVALLGCGYAYEVQERRGAEQQLADVEAQARVLQGEQAKYADVPRTVAAIDAAEAARESAMAKDVEWSRTLTSFSLSVPENVWFTTVTLSVGNGATAAGTGAATSGGAATTGASSSAGATAATGATATPGAGSAAAGIGTVSVQGNARSHRDVATWLEALAEQDGMSNAYFTSSQKEKIGSKPVVKFSSTATVTTDALSHRYDRKQG